MELEYWLGVVSKKPQLHRSFAIGLVGNKMSAIACLDSFMLHRSFAIGLVGNSVLTSFVFSLIALHRSFAIGLVEN